MRRRESGSIAVSAAFFLLLSATLLGLVFNAGLVHEERVRLGGAAQASALAGARGLCTNTAQGYARALLAPGVDRAIELGVFDERAPATTPQARFVVVPATGPRAASANAVQVSLSSRVPTLLGFRPARVSARAVAYLRDVGVAALGPQSEVRLANVGGRFASGSVHSNGDVVINGSPDIAGLQVSAAGDAFDATASFITIPGGIRIPGNDPFELRTRRSGAGLSRRPGVLDQIRPVDADLLAEYAEAADRTYEPGAGSDGVLYGILSNNSVPRLSTAQRLMPHFDLTAVSGDGERITVFFDGDPDGWVALQARASGVRPNAAGPDLRSVTFVSRGNVVLAAGGAASRPDPVGGAGQAAFRIVSGGDIVVTATALDFRGATLRAGRDITLSTTFTALAQARGAQRLRLIADGDVEIRDQGATYDFGFGSPCPVTLAELGTPENAAR